MVAIAFSQQSHLLEGVLVVVGEILKTQPAAARAVAAARLTMALCPEDQEPQTKVTLEEMAEQVERGQAQAAADRAALAGTEADQVSPETEVLERHRQLLAQVLREPEVAAVAFWEELLAQERLEEATEQIHRQQAALERRTLVAAGAGAVILVAFTETAAMAVQVS